MWDNATTMMVVEGIFVTLYMTLATTFMGYVLGLPMGIALVITAPKGLRPNKIIYKVLDVVVNVVRSFPFLILLIVIQPLTRIIVGKSYGPTATIVPLTLSAAPFIARMVESSLLEVDHGVIEAAQSMGASEPLDHHLESNDRRGKDFPDRQCNDCPGYDSGILRYGGYRRRWRTG